MPRSVFGADQPAEALLELDDGLGDLVLDERVAAAPADRPRAGPPAAGGSGTLNGSRTMITFESASPGTSTPCQKLSAPKITLSTSALNASTIFDRGMPSLWANRAMFRSANQGVERPGGGLEHLVRREQDERLAVRSSPGNAAIARIARRSNSPGWSEGSGRFLGQVDRHLAGVVERAAELRASRTRSGRAAP